MMSTKNISRLKNILKIRYLPLDSQKARQARVFRVPGNAG